MIEASDLTQDPSNGQWWVSAQPDLEVLFDSGTSRPSEAHLAQANAALGEIARLVQQAIEYIDIWVDRSRPGIGIEHELRSIKVIASTRKGGQTRLEFGFPEDDDSRWWVLFNNPTPPFPGGEPKYGPIAFGREQE